jgi:hypothetical protein
MLQARLFQRAELIAGRKSGRLSNDMDPDDQRGEPGSEFYACTYISGGKIEESSR